MPGGGMLGISFQTDFPRAAFAGGIQVPEGRGETETGRGKDCPRGGDSSAIKCCETAGGSTHFRTHHARLAKRICRRAFGEKSSWKNLSSVFPNAWVPAR